MTELTTSITTALSTLQGDVVKLLGGVVAGGLAIFGVKFAATQGIGFFKRIAK